MNEIMDIILQRRSIRKYTQQPVEKDKLILLLKAAMAAPTACNNQPWEFIVVTESQKMDELRQSLEYGKHNAPAAIIVCHSPEKGHNKSCDLFWIEDCSAAIENMLIAAVGLDLGTVWLAVYPKQDAIDSITKNFNIPVHITPLAVIYVGYPAEHKPPRTQYEENRVHWEKY